MDVPQVPLRPRRRGARRLASAGELRVSEKMSMRMIELMSPDLMGVLLSNTVNQLLLSVPFLPLSM